MPRVTTGDALIREVGLRVAEVRISKGRTQQQLADALEVDTKFLQRIESGKQNLTLRSIARIAGTLGVAPADLLRRARRRQRPAGRPAKR